MTAGYVATRRLLAACTAALLLLLSGSARPAAAQFITTSSALQSPTVVTFASFLNTTTYIGAPLALTTDGLVTIRNVSPVDRPQPAIYNDAFNLGGYFPNDAIFNDPEICTNGQWTAARAGFVGMAPRSAVRVEFGGRAITGVGATMNYTPLCGTFDQSPPLMRLLDATGGVLETFNIDALGRITLPNQQNAGAFRGAVRSQGDAYAVEFVGGTLVFDDLTFSLATPPTTSVPEPSTLPLLLVGLGALGVTRGRRGASAPEQPM